MSTVKLNPYLNFNGQAREVITFYHSIFGGELNMQTHGEAMPDQAPEDMRDKIMHAQLESGDILIMASDAPFELTPGGNVVLSLVGTDETKLTGYFDALAEGGNVEQPLEKQFWGDTFGMLTDKYGIRWMANIVQEGGVGTHGE